MGVPEAPSGMSAWLSRPFQCRRGGYIELSVLDISKLSVLSWANTKTSTVYVGADRSKRQITDTRSSTAHHSTPSSLDRFLPDGLCGAGCGRDQTMICIRSTEQAPKYLMWPVHHTTLHQRSYRHLLDLGTYAMSTWQSLEHRTVDPERANTSLCSGICRATTLYSTLSSCHFRRVRHAKRCCCKSRQPPPPRGTCPSVQSKYTVLRSALLGCHQHARDDVEIELHRRPQGSPTCQARQLDAAHVGPFGPVAGSAPAHYVTDTRPAALNPAHGFSLT